MPLRQRAIGLSLLAIVLGAGLAPAVAQDDAFSDAPPRRIRVVRRPVGPPAYVAPPAIVSDYLPRNNAVPMYNEPPGLRDRGYFGR